MPAPHHSAVDKALDVLEVVGQVDVPLRLSEIASQVGLHRATAYRVLQELVRRGWVMRAGDHYLPGTAVLHLYAAASRRSLAVVCRPALEELSCTTGLMVNLQVLEGRACRVVHAVRPARLAMINHMDGDLLPVHRFAGPLALLASMDDDARRPFLDAADADGYPLTGPDGLLADVARTREQGYALTRGRHDAFVASMSRAVHSEQGAPICALTLVGPVAEFADTAVPKLNEQLVAAVAKVNRLLIELHSEETE